MTTTAQPTIILIHGLWGSPIDMMILAFRLRWAGYRVHNYGYWSMRGDIAAHGRKLRHYIYARGLDRVPDLHLIGHSLGGLVIRAAAGQSPAFPNLKTIVLLGTPNNGSAWVDLWRRRPVTRRLFDGFYGPAGRQLETSPHVRDNLFGPITCPVGVIAGTTSWVPGTQKLFGETNDGLVGLNSTRFPGMTDFTTLPAPHAFLMDGKAAASHILHFLQHGHFKKD